ncbi:hypothetical protein FDP41_009221 [Naegleria fowleri]|uniref:Cilia- and flagella-associated protein 43 n=1 Tax=Naegleria fowleri TaxID=5763 RepID=A0A6A5BEF3_NAEFO|nr:uncharacterized protein FDP41_009221 [Naegleria fowleri]KAF0972318.1 hypothetical protein FDP41_009221 [Naegleria fowleri]
MKSRLTISSEMICSNGYGGKRIHVVDNETIAFICGRGLRFINLETKEENFFLPDIYIDEPVVAQNNNSFIDDLENAEEVTQRKLYLTAGVCTAAFNRKKGVFAIADSYSNPKIRIYNSKTFELLRILSGGGIIEFFDLDFSRDGSFLASLSGIPDHSLKIWDWERGIVIAETKAPNTSKFANFNPRNKMQLCTSGIAHLAFWEINSTIDSYELHALEPKVSENVYEKIKTTEKYRHGWGKNNDILCVTSDGDFLHFENFNSNGVILDLDDSKDSMHDIAVCKHSCIIGLSDGNVKIVGMSHVINSTGNYEGTASRIINLGHRVGDVINVTLSGNFKYILAGTSDGGLFRIYIKGFETEFTTEFEIMKNEVNITLLYDSHVGSVSGVFQVEPKKIDSEEDKTILTSVGMDGTVRVWNYKRNILLAKRRFNALFSCAEYSNGLLFVGSTVGFLRIFEFDDKYQPVLIYCQRLRTASITGIKVGGPGDSMVAISFSDFHLGFVYLRTRNTALDDKNSEDMVDIDTSLEDDDEEISVLGFCKFSNKIATLSWASKNGLYVATDIGDLYMVEPPTSFEEVILLNNITKDLWKLDYPCYGISTFSDDPYHIYAISQDKSIKIYDLNLEDRQSGISNNVITPSSEVLCHHKVGECIKQSPDGTILCTGAKDGVVWIRVAQTNFYEQTDDDHIAQMHPFHNSYDGGISCVSFSSDGNYIFSSGYDGSIYVYCLDPSENITKTTFMSVTPKSSSKDKCDPIPESADAKTILELKTESQNKLENMMKETKKEQFNSQLEDLRKMFIAIKEENDIANEDERLSESEFIIDDEFKKLLEKEGEKEAEKLKECMKIENAKKDIMAKRIKKECWDSMEEHATSIVAFKMTSDYQKDSSLLEVSNYVIRKKDPRKEVILGKIAFLRRVEEINLCERRKEYITSNIEGGIHNEDDETEPIKRADSRVIENGESKAEESENLLDFGKKWKESIRSKLILDMNALLYPYTDLYTRQRKATQILLLQDKIDKMMKQFNSEFKTARDEKLQVIRKIERINEVINDIAKELSRCSETPVKIEIFDPKLKPSEKPEQYILQVSEEELPAKYESSEFSKQSDKKKDQSSRVHDKEVIQRALNMMMDGKLDLDNTDVKEEEIPVPSCINKEKSELSDQELKELRVYESLLKQREEERIKKVKQLEAKLNNSKQQIEDVCQEFDNSLKLLFLKKASK